MSGRFAPTPSGRMHLGNAYAMLAAWLSARARGEEMRLRIEDIDVPRVMPGADAWIRDDLAWLGLDWSGDVVYQSRRTALYDEVFATLCDAGLLYPCFCSRAEIRAASAPQEGDRFIVYPGTCRRLHDEHPDEAAARVRAGERHAWRLAAPHAGAREGRILFDDRVYGAQDYDLGSALGDVVLRRSDGLYAYQFVVTLDDLLMGVDDIVRGRDLLRSTALQIWLRQRLLDCGIGGGSDGSGGDVRWTPAQTPDYAHLPLLDNAAGVRLAKRVRSLDLGHLREQGVRPQAVVGYCAWALGLVERPRAMDAPEALACFDWRRARAVCGRDLKVPDDIGARLLAM
ncbi:glutamyl-Q tRNA(Asp) synthetase [Bifidobacterium choerinum]|uniref:Glutamyl-Q tRNA(Asp) synthetase n=3 Tax=Bifidobacterium choerinum TaxID=35760 RepID=A0A087A9A3_9BIFI|nr:glutamyl-Q tRNA(Asp) synthetase [Bifidobacterium choerinum]KFI55353.1 glutamyl-Q tRNA(Asp) synthetase [Bifidobacterium choerinum]